MTPQLQTLDGQPLTWPELLALNEAYWARERARQAEQEAERVVWMPRRRLTRTEVREWQAS